MEFSPEFAKKFKGTRFETYAESEEEHCQKFDTGVYNDIMMSYVTNAMYLCDMPKETAERFLNAISEELNTHNAEEALTIYRKRSNRW